MCLNIKCKECGHKIPFNKVVYRDNLWKHEYVYNSGGKYTAKLYCECGRILLEQRIPWRKVLNLPPKAQ